MCFVCLRVLMHIYIYMYIYTYTLLGVPRYSLIYGWLYSSLLENCWLILFQIFFWSILCLLFFLDSIYTYNRSFIFFIFSSLCFTLYTFYWPIFQLNIHQFCYIWSAVKSIKFFIGLFNEVLKYIQGRLVCLACRACTASKDKSKDVCGWLTQSYHCLSF